MQMKVEGTVDADFRHVREHGLQELLEFGGGHLAGCHLELAVLDRAEASDMAIDRDIVGRVGKYNPGLLAIHQLDVSGLVAGIGANQAVLAELPEIAEPGDGLALRCRHHVTGVGLCRHRWPIDQQIDFCRLKSSDFQIEVEFGGGELPPQQRQLLHIPVAIERDLVIGE